MMRFIGYFALIAGLIDVSCSSNPTIAGGAGTETTNAKVSGAVMSSDGTPALNATVRLRRSDYVTATPSLAKPALYGGDAVTDESGRFEITGIDPGSYRIEANDGYSAVLFDCIVDTNDTAKIDLGTDTLRPFAAIQGTVDSAGHEGQPAYVRIYGLERLVAVSAAGRFILNDLPAGMFTILVVTAEDSAVAAASGITIATGVRTDVTITSGWRFSKRLYLNTTASGAGVSEDVSEFPLLVRLTGMDFDFTQTLDSGQDMRFVNEDGTALPYEIEQWDQATQQATIWVRVDTVYANNERQFITMLWGSNNAFSQSNGSAVFDTADGCAAVWHMDEGGRDATANANHATNIGTLSSAGIAGPSRRFAGGSDAVVIDTSISLSKARSAITISAWIKTSERYGAERMLFDHGHWSGDLGTYNLSTLNDSVASLAFRGGSTWASAVMAFSDGQWNLITATFDGAASVARVYLNGTLRGTTTVSGIIAENRAESCIGNRQGSAMGFVGDIDEVRIFDHPQTAAWIKLSYMNQKLTDALIVR